MVASRPDSGRKPLLDKAGIANAKKTNRPKATTHILWLDIAGGKLTKVAESGAQFREMAEIHEKREEWFAESDERKAASRGLTPNNDQCIAFSVPLAFATSGSNNKPFLVDIYQQVAFSGDMHKQLSHCRKERRCD